MNAIVDIQPTADLASLSPADHTGCYSIRGPRWACIYTNPQAELWANSNLRRAGYQTFLPTHTIRQRDRVVASMHHTVVRPLFPRYLFLMFDHHTASWSPIRAIPGVADILRSGHDLHYAPDAVVSVLQATEDARRAIPPAGSQWAPGMAVSLATGAWHGHQAVVVSVTRGIAHVALMLFGCVRDVTVSVDCLVARD